MHSTAVCYWFSFQGYCDFFTEEQLLEAVALGQKAVAGICRGLAEWTDAERGGAGKPKRTDCLDLPPPELEAKIEVGSCTSASVCVLFGPIHVH